MGLVSRMTGAMGRRWFQPPIWDAAAKSAKLPAFRDPSPSAKRQGLKEMRAAARHLARNNHRFAIALGKKNEILIGTGPKPKSIYPDLVALWEEAKDHFDTTGKGFAEWLADDVNLNREVDGEIFTRLRKRNKYDDPAYRARNAHLPVPIQFQALPAEFVDDAVETEWIGNLRFKQGVALRDDQRLGYAFWTSHPGETDDVGLPPTRFVVPAAEVCHLFTAGTGAIRGEIPLAPVIKTAKDLQDTEDSELNRRKASQFWATYLVKKASADGLTQLGGPPGQPHTPGSRGPDKSTRNLAMGMGDMAVLEEGYEPKMVQPAGEGAGFQTAVRIQTSLITNLIGLPYHEAMNDWDAVPERAMRPASVSMKRRMLKDRTKLERLLNWMWRHFVIVCVEEGLWTPPPGAAPAEIFKASWRWPVIHTVTPEREMKTGAELVGLGLLTPEQFVEDFVGDDYKEHLRRLVTNVAQAKAQGLTIYDDVFDPEVPIAADYMTVAEEEEGLQRQLVRTARLDRSARRRSG